MKYLEQTSFLLIFYILYAISVSLIPNTATAKEETSPFAAVHNFLLGHYTIIGRNCDSHPYGVNLLKYW
ncbi:hypothetical protein TI04_11775 [Achromatium sp. WMS2]|nr:hypothetical protein TI04_11775 [Achromatium sp. WMS2]